MSLTDIKIIQEEKVLLLATVCFPMRGSEILLARKTRKIGAGCWNGYGGKPNVGEGLRDAAIRELYEESGLSALSANLSKIAIMEFHNTKLDGTIFVARVHFFTLNVWQGDYRATDEMEDPTWFQVDNLPLSEMMPADRIFLPIALGGMKIIGSAHYSPFQKELISEVVYSEATLLPEK